MDDTIYRQAALDVLRTCYDTEIKQYSDGSEWINYEDAVEGMKTLPPAKPERKTGMWIVSDDKYWHTCPFCNADIDVSMGTGVYVGNDEVNHVNYCPNCGARMEVEE